jgi:two-component system chemotaxis response regulator CheY
VCWPRTDGAEGAQPRTENELLNQTVLICDDMDFIRTVMREILQRAGFDVVGEAVTGLQAIAKYKELRPDLVTMDVVMPDMSGIEAVREICAFDADARILMCSAVEQQPIVAEAIRAGARDFVAKPFRPSSVLEAVQRVLT